MNKKIIVLIIISLFLLSACSKPMQDGKIGSSLKEYLTSNGIVAGESIKNITFTDKNSIGYDISSRNNETTIKSREGLTRFVGSKTVFTPIGDRLKYDIIFNNKKGEWYYTDIESDSPIKNLGSLRYLINGVEHSFNMEYNKTNPRSVQYVVYEPDMTLKSFNLEFSGRSDLSFFRVNRTHVAIVQTEYDYEPLIKVEQTSNNTLRISSKIKVYDPILSSWNNGSRTARFDFEEGSGDTLIDAAGNPNGHNGALTSGSTNFTYVANITPGGGYSGKYLSSAYHDLGNSTDLNSMGEFETNIVINTLDPTASAEQAIMGDDSNNFRFKTRSGRIIFKMSLTTTNCNIDWFEYSSFLTANTNYNLTATYNGTHCQVLNAGTALRTEAASGTWSSNDFTPWTLGGGVGDLSLNGTMDCVNVHVGSTLTQGARNDAFDSCYNVGAAPAYNCTYP